MSAVMEVEMIEAGMVEIEANTNEYCAGGALHYLVEMSECDTCGAFMCGRHIAAAR